MTAPLTKNCLICSQLIKKTPNRSLKDWHNRTKCCSPRCRSQYTALKNKGGNSGSFSKLRFANKANHPRWKGGRSSTSAYHTLYARHYKARKQNAVGSFSIDQWNTLKAFFHNTCMACLAPSTTLQADHINPLALGGSNFISNIQPLCHSCNARKGARYLDYRLSLLDIL